MKTNGLGWMALTVVLAVGMLARNCAMASVDLGTFTAGGPDPGGSGMSAVPVAASVHFVDLGNHQLQITLANTESGDAGYIQDVLYGVFFSGATITGLSSGDAAAGSRIWTYPSGSGNATATPPLTANTALTDPWQTDTSGSLKGIDALSGSDKEGLVPTQFSGTTHTDGIGNSQHQPYDESTAVFILTYSGSIRSINDVEFLYGTTVSSSDEISGMAVVPEPTTLSASALLLLPFGASVLRFRAKRG